MKLIVARQDGFAMNLTVKSLGLADGKHCRQEWRQESAMDGKRTHTTTVTVIDLVCTLSLTETYSMVSLISSAFSRVWPAERLTMWNLEGICRYPTSAHK